MTILPSVFYLYDQPLNNGSFGDFTTTASIIPPDYTLTSTATLRGAQFSHNNFVLECLTFQPVLISSTKMVTIRGNKCAHARYKPT